MSVKNTYWFDIALSHNLLVDSLQNLFIYPLRLAFSFDAIADLSFHLSDLLLKHCYFLIVGPFFFSNLKQNK
jgi:hypothetical protein